MNISLKIYLLIKLLKFFLQFSLLKRKRTQQDRSRAMHEFNEGIKPLLICTNINARGLDIFEVKTVINYDLPDLVHDDIETYIYRIGRTGRAGNSGKSISMFVKGRDEGLAQALVLILAKVKLIFYSET